MILINLKGRAQLADLPQGYPEFNIDISNDVSDGYLFWGPMPIGKNNPGWLIIMDKNGTPVYFKETKTKTYCFQPYPDGNLAYFDGSILKYVSMDSSYIPVDTMGCIGCDRFDLHELRILENGHYLLAGFKYRIVDMSLIVPGGNPAATIIDYLIEEIDPDGQVVFEWNTADHYEITDADDAVDLTVSSIDPTSFCSIEVDTDTTLILSMAHQNEVTKIDRRSGEIIWRMGGKNNEFTFVNSTRPFTRQHDVRRLGNGNITMMDGGLFSSPFYSRAVEYEIDEENKIATQIWEYDHNKTVQSTHKGSVQRLPNGNTLIGWGGFGGTNPAVPSATEVKPDGTKVYEISTPLLDGSYRIVKYPWKTNLFVPLTDSVNFGNWNGYTESVYLLLIKNKSDAPVTLTSASLLTQHFYVDETFPVNIPANGQITLKVVFYPIGAAENTALNDVLTINNDDLTKKQRIAIQVHLRGFVPDIISPSVSFIPDNNVIEQNENIKILFSEPVINTDNSEITDQNVSSLIIFRKDNINGENTSFYATINPGKTEITVDPSEALITGQNYFIRIGSVQDNSGNMTMPASRTFNVSIPTSVNIPAEGNRWKIFPNPVREKLFIRSDNEVQSRLELFDGMGKLIIFKNVDKASEEIELHGIPAGIYLLRIISGDTNSVITRKLIIEGDR